MHARAFHRKQVHAGDQAMQTVPKGKSTDRWFYKILEQLGEYIYANVKYLKNKWKKINNKIYYFDKNVMADQLEEI